MNFRPEEFNGGDDRLAVCERYHAKFRLRSLFASLPLHFCYYERASLIRKQSEKRCKSCCSVYLDKEQDAQPYMKIRLDRGGRTCVYIRRMCICVPLGSMSNPLFRNTKLWAGFFAHFLCAFISSLQFKAVVRMNYIVAC